VAQEGCSGSAFVAFIQTDDLEVAAHFAEANGLEVTMHGRRAFHGGDRQIYVRMLRRVAF